MRQHLRCALANASQLILQGRPIEPAFRSGLHRPDQTSHLFRQRDDFLLDSICGRLLRFVRHSIHLSAILATCGGVR